MSEFWKEHTTTCGVKPTDKLTTVMKKYMDEEFVFPGFIVQAVNEYASKVLELSDELRKADEEKQGRSLINPELWICAARSWQATMNAHNKKGDGNA